MSRICYCILAAAVMSVCIGYSIEKRYQPLLRVRLPAFNEERPAFASIDHRPAFDSVLRSRLEKYMHRYRSIE